MSPKIEKRLVGDGKFYGQLTVERGFDTKEEAEQWARNEATRFEVEGLVDSISRSVWEPV